MASDYAFADEEMEVDDSVGFPRAFARLCRDRAARPYGHGPPFTFMPYALHDGEALRAREMEQIFPIIDRKAKQTAKPRLFVSLLWKQLSHLGNAGFDPTVIRVDPYGNVLYYHADSASPLAWEIDHWFPCSRGGLTVPSNLRILQWQVCKKKHNKLEFLIPWWDLQLGISVNQFLSVFASSNSDFRHRAFSFLFADGENEELNSSQTVDSHSFPQHFVESKEQLGLAPAAIVASRRDSHGSSSSILQSVDYNRLRSRSPAIAARKLRTCKENENPDFHTNPYQAIAMARDSLKQREEAAKLQAEAQMLDDEVSETRRRNEEERLSIQDLELALIKRRRRAEKCRRLAEAQSSYKTMLEKMIRDAMHQSVVYKEQVRLNQAATSALTARLEAQRSICDASEKELHKKYKQRDELEKQIRPDLEQARKRFRMDETLIDEERERKAAVLPLSRPRTPMHKELRVFLEEENKASEAGLSLSEEERRFVIENRKLIKNSENKFSIDKRGEQGGKAIIVSEDEKATETLVAEKKPDFRFPTPRQVVIEQEEEQEDEETRKERGKGNVEKWLQKLLEDSNQEQQSDDPPRDEAEIGNFDKSDDMIEKSNQESPKCEKNATEKSNVVERVGSCSRNFEERRSPSVGKERKVTRSESSRGLRRIPSSPLIMLGMKKGVDCIGKKPMVTGDDDEEEEEEERISGSNSFLKSSIKTLKKAVKI